VVPVVCACAACREEFSADEPVLACPECGSRGITRLSGDEFTVREIELDDEPAEVS
jgi:Zn finger protein HypA/HybF involved in hydrogenase expression